MRCLRVQELGKRGWSRCHAALEDNHAGAVKHANFGLFHRYVQSNILLHGRSPSSTNSEERRALLTARKLLQKKALVVDNDIRGLLRSFRMKIGPIGASKFETRTRELVDGMPELAEIIDPFSRPAGSCANCLPFFTASCW